MAWTGCTDDTTAGDSLGADARQHDVLTADDLGTDVPADGPAEGISDLDGPSDPAADGPSDPTADPPRDTADGPTFSDVTKVPYPDADAPADVADDPSGAGDVATDAGVDTGDTGSPVLTWLEEPTGGDEWPDCFSDCGSRSYLDVTYPLSVTLDGETVIVGEQPYLGLSGTIDDRGDHTEGYDSDFVRVVAPTGTLVEIVVEAEEGSPADPFLELYDPDFFPLAGVMRTNDDRAPGDSAARLVIATPYPVGEKPFFARVDDATNLDSGSAGGAAYRYRVTFSVTPFVPTDLAFVGGTATADGEVVAAGDINYYRFVGDPGDTPTVSFQSTDHGFMGYLVGFVTSGGRIQWRNYAVDSPRNGNETLGSEAFAVDSAGIFMFAVSDWDGEGSNLGGSYTYSLSVTR